jgi:hypothetical protein
MRLKEYGRNANKRKEYVHQPDLLLVGVDVSKAKHHACMGTQTTMPWDRLVSTGRPSTNGSTAVAKFFLPIARDPKLKAAYRL